MRALAFVLGRRRGAFARALALTLLSNAGIAALTPLFLRRLFDRSVAARDMRGFLIQLAAFAALATAWRLLNLARLIRIQRLKNVLADELVSESLRKFYRLPYEETLRRHAGYFASRAFDEPASAATLVVDLALDSAASAASFAAGAVILAAVSWPAAAFLAVCVPPLVWLSGRYAGAVRRGADAEKEAESELRGFLSRAVQAYRSVRVFALGAAVDAGLDDKLLGYLDGVLERVRASMTHATASGILMSYAETLVIAVCGWQMMTGRMTFGGFMAFMSAFWAAVSSLRALALKGPDLARAEAAVARVRAHLDAPEAAAPASAGMRLNGAALGFDGTAVVSGLNLRVEPGERVLLSGRNGSGKSTAAAALIGLLAPLSGEADAPALSRVSAGLSPHHFIPGTVADNLQVGRLDPERRRYLDALLADFDLDGVLDRDPESLSSGQRKKTEVVAALLKDADYYLFDEPLANVDAPSKERVMARIFERSAGRGLVMVMHGDDAYKSRFDRVVELDRAA